MPSRPTKWYHRLFGTVDKRRRLRDIALRQIGLARSHMPLPLVGRSDLAMPNVVRGVAAEILLREGQLTFVQVGAFDGGSEDDLTSLLDFPGVRGALVEPQPEPFAELSQRFAHHENIHFVNAAIAADAGHRKLYRPSDGRSRLASLDRNNLLRHGVRPEDISCDLVRCLTLSQLLEDLRFTSLDVLQVDAEGYDLDVLATLDLDRWQPVCIRFEYLHIESCRLAKCLDQLANRGYRFLVQERDIVAARQESWRKAA